MTYIDEISGSLLRVLTVACDGPPHRFAGYAANADFWVDEARHCLDVIGGYEKRFRAMKSATDRYEPSGRHGLRTRDIPFDPRITKSTKSNERNVAKTQVTDAARRFLRRCEKAGALDQTAVIALCERLQVSYPP